MSSGATPQLASPLKLEFPQSLAVYDDYAAAQKAVDFLSDKEFPVEKLHDRRHRPQAGRADHRPAHHRPGRPRRRRCRASGWACSSA